MAGTVSMSVENNNNNLVITISKDIVDMKEVQKFINYLRYKALVSKSQATEEDVEQLTAEINEGIGARRQKHVQK